MKSAMKTLVAFTLLYPLNTALAAGRQFTLEQDGLRLQWAIESTNPADASLEAGNPLDITLTITDGAAGTAVPGLRPGGWLNRRRPGYSALAGEQCLERIRSYAGGPLGIQADVDINQFFVVSINADRSVSVINPTISFSRTKLAAMLDLPADPHDAVVTKDQRYVLISFPSRGSLLPIDTRTFKSKPEITTNGAPARLAATRGATVWVADDKAGELVELDVASRQIVRRVAVGPGPIQLATNASGTTLVAAYTGGVAVVSANDGTVRSRHEVAGRPTAITMSDLAGAAFVAYAETGRVAGIRFDGSELATAILKAGISALATTPDGRFVLAANRESDDLTVIEASTGRATRSIPVGDAPEQIVISKAMAYVRLAGRSQVTLVQWTGLDHPEAAAVVAIAVGESAPGAGLRSVAIPSMVVTPMGDSALIAGLTDKQYFHYMEGMMAPNGSLQNSSRVPLGALLVDRGMKEIAAGVYRATVTVPRSGLYDFPFMIDSPRTYGCLEFEAVGGANAPPDESPFIATLLQSAVTRSAGGTVTVSFELQDRRTKQLRAGLSDFQVLATQTEGNFQQRRFAIEREPGRYEVQFTLPIDGKYVLHLGSVAAGLKRGDLVPFTITVAP